MAAPPPAPPLPNWTLGLLPPPPAAPYNVPSKPVFPCRRAEARRLKDQKNKRKASHPHQPSTPLLQISASFAFLQLPREIRLMIYNYLIPNTKPDKWCGKPQRHDGPCHANILAVCRSIHDEALDLFYSKTMYAEIDISNNGIFYLGQRYLLDAPLPPTIRLAQSMCARIQLEWRSVRQENFKNRITEIFPENSRLKNLQLYFQATSPAYVGRKATPEVVIAALESTLSPLRSVAKDLGPGFHINFEKHVHQGRFPVSLGTALNEVVRGYFRRWIADNGDSRLLNVQTRE